MKKYVRPEMDVVEFENEDIITTSCPIHCSNVCSEWCGAADCFEGG